MNMQQAFGITHSGGFCSAKIGWEDISSMSMKVNPGEGTLTSYNDSLPECVIKSRSANSDVLDASRDSPLAIKSGVEGKSQSMQATARAPLVLWDSENVR